MWCLETINALNNEAAHLANAGLPEAEASKRLGILPVRAVTGPQPDNGETAVSPASPLPQSSQPATTNP